MQSLEGLDCRKSAPVDRIDVPHNNRTQETTDTIAKQSNRDDSQHDGGWAQRQIIEEILCGKNGYTSGSIGGRRSSDSTDGVLFEIPGPVVEERDNSDPSWELALAASLPPSSFIVIATRKKGGPSLAGEVGDQDYKSPRDRDLRWFELYESVNNW